MCNEMTVVQDKLDTLWTSVNEWTGSYKRELKEIEAVALIDARAAKRLDTLAVYLDKILDTNSPLPFI